MNQKTPDPMHEIYQSLEINQQVMLEDPRKYKDLLKAMSRIRDRSADKRWFTCNEIDGQIFLQRMESREHMMEALNSKKKERENRAMGIIEYTHSLSFSAEVIEDIVSGVRTEFSSVMRRGQKCEYPIGLCSIRVMKVSSRHPQCEGFPVYKDGKQLRLKVVDRSISEELTEDDYIARHKFQTEWV